MIFREWQEFVTYPLDPNRVRTKAERLDTSEAFRRGLDGKYPQDCKPSSSRATIIDLGMIVYDGDVFERMEVTDQGDVLIWTHEKVWMLLRKNTAGIEKLIYVPRHPPERRPRRLTICCSQRRLALAFPPSRTTSLAWRGCHLPAIAVSGCSNCRGNAGRSRAHAFTSTVEPPRRRRLRPGAVSVRLIGAVRRGIITKYQHGGSPLFKRAEIGRRD